MLFPDGTHHLELRRFKPSFEAVGIVVDFLARAAPFDGYHAGPLVTAVKYQIVNGYHVAGFNGETLIGYCGWLQITCADGESWLQGVAELRPTPPEYADAVALHVVRIDESAAVRPLIRACRTLEPKKRVFFKRDYIAGSRPTRRNTAMNISAAPTGRPS